jgi:hypothetical protein
VGREDDVENLEALKTGLARARIPARVSHRAFLGNVTGRIVQMDILKEKNREELRVSVPDGDGTEVQVLGIDALIQQAVLLVREPEREFVERVWNRDRNRLEDVVRKTSAEKRRFLVGMDECHLFIAQLTSPATTVRQAHEGLRPRGVPAGRAAKKLGFVRQGEWFFQPASSGEVARVEALAKAGGVARNVGIGRGREAMRGRPHVVSESVLVLVSKETRESIEFVRGRVKHPDHRTIELHGWHKVFLNTEDRVLLSRFSSWVD